MAKTKEQILAKGKQRRQKNKVANQELKLRKNWYPVTDAKNHFKRKCRIPKPTHIHKKLTPGQIVILLSGRFRGRRVVYLKNLEKTNLLLVTGPYKINGVPLKRVNAAYVLPTNTKLNLNANVAAKINDDFFKKVELKKSKDKDFFEKDFVEDPATKKARIIPERANAQNEIDVVVKKAVDEIPEMKGYLRNRFALKNGDKPHLMKF